ncbi:hypothetical protein [Streptomyces chromofuscus]|uniref:Uncharacterized protein n=1 Tax=Streptomyces chromofuscus TaxID=42881 RepID=A0A7M2T478_STRCW|nr:hypothetical protein [Streptomyces chromofuscus]QOV43382.1 hypothetical protein IPT68_27135 [Streptomyces chromofuscus]GGT41747.1 hypothetical protein GCM10010254_71760 [Streptomyces chromofuscus]
MALSKFKERVDDLLRAFEGSAGGASKVAAHSLSQAAFGMGDFPEAKALHLEYERVHERITSLSKSLGLQLEAMQIAVHGVDVTFDNLEEEARYRFHQIRAEVNQQRDAMLDEHLQRENKADLTDAGY